ncbi:putative membrane protein YedE/YeeE [Bacillus iocasae]|uniref:Membrane protein YedE/YeeE n=2 Tax=Priestia iocasae TaxID=2291674 RepID=A0ABS2QT18_9BACI|nr:putative membrane protein YedE/YeeE [Metabacillus iocasae]
MRTTVINQQNSLHKQHNPLAPSPLKEPKNMLVGAGLIGSAVLGSIIVGSEGSVQGVLFILGLLLGFTLFHARFGFTSAFRRLMAVGNGEALRAHMVMLAVATTLFALILSSGLSFTGVTPTGYVSPVGVSLLFGSFIFGIGMQLGNGCASGTLYSLGGGSSSMWITLTGFIVGSVVATAHFDFWMNDMPSLPAISLAESTGLGYLGAWFVQMTIFGLIFLLTIYLQKKKNPPKMKQLPTVQGWKRIFRGSWPILVAAIVLAVLNAVTLMVRGQPWGITSAFALWGAKVATAIGIDVTQWSYWQQDAQAASLTQSVLADSTSVMNFGIMLGAFLASSIAGIFALKKIRPGVAAASLIGGLMMGYGARLAFGCNIGAYFGGIASFSLHGWVWMVMAMLGTYLALFIRPLFGLSNPKPNDSVC